MFKLNNLKTKTILAMSFIAVSSFLTSCEKEDDKDKPKIELHELGMGNSLTVSAGSDLHIEAAIEADYGIDEVEVEIHMEDESAGWYFDTVYTEYEGLKNTDFHKHVDVPASATTGEYHFHLVVTDLEGNSTTVEEHIDIE